MVKLEILQKRMKKAHQYLGYLKEIRAKNDLESILKEYAKLL
jgi:hypothetical protein